MVIGSPSGGPISGVSYECLRKGLSPQDATRREAVPLVAPFPTSRSIAGSVSGVPTESTTVVTRQLPQCKGQRAEACVSPPADIYGILKLVGLSVSTCEMGTGNELKVTDISERGGGWGSIYLFNNSRSMCQRVSVSGDWCHMNLGTQING